MPASRHPLLLRWFAQQGWEPYPFQLEAWQAHAEGKSGLIHVPTGAGKTYAAYGGPLSDLINEALDPATGELRRVEGLRILLITPLRAVSRDTALALAAPIADLGLQASANRPRASAPEGAATRAKRSSAEPPSPAPAPTPSRRSPVLSTPPGLTIETRTGDTSASTRAKQKDRLPSVLVTTPESLSLLLTWPDAADRFKHLNTVIIDEWHELLSTKRGTQVELALARLRRFAPTVRTWALSATLQNLDEAAQAAVGHALGRTGFQPVPSGIHPPQTAEAASLCHQSPTPNPFTLISANIDRPILIDSVLPAPGDPFPWAGHLGLSQLTRVLEALELAPDGLPKDSTLLFVNTRSQAERWFSALCVARPQWEHAMALHHGSLDRDERERVETGLKDGTIRLVVATSSLDLGVDFAPVERVFQVGSPKGIARLMQRAGRASHRPGAACRITCVPTHALEMVEVAAVRRAVATGRIEPRTGESCPLDVLAQHLVTVALGGGFTPEEMYAEVRTAHAYRTLTREDFDWTLDLVTTGGPTLRAYPEYKKVRPDDADQARFVVPDKKIAHLHRMNVGTITSDAVMEIRYLNGARIGTIEENFIQRLRPGEKFVFAGKVLAYHATRDLTAFVKPASGATNHTPIWGGTRLPISESLSEAVRHTLASASIGAFDPIREPELAAASRLVDVQRRLSIIPGAGETLAEICTTREGAHLFIYPFEGRLVHGGLAALLALRLTRTLGATFSTATNDYGFELLTEKGYPFADLLTPELFESRGLLDDAVHSVNLSALAKAQFREVARVAGLVIQSYPGMPRSARQVQARSGLLFEVFEQFDPGNLLLTQARREVLEKQFEQSRLARTLARLAEQPMVIRTIARPTPLSLPLVVERLAARLSSESIEQRIEKMRAAWDGGPAAD